MTPSRTTKNAPTGAGSPDDPREIRAAPWALLLLAVLAVQGLLFIRESSQTSDEAAHLAAGYSYLETADFRLNPEHPPLIKEWAALPLLFAPVNFPWGPLWDQSEEWNIGRIFVHENTVSNDTILLLGRLPILTLSLLLGWFLFRWARTLFGPRGALLSLALYVLDPNVVAHSCLVTTDLGVTLFMFLAVYALWAWSEDPSPGRLLLCGLAIGGALASKFTALWLLPVLFGLFTALLVLGVPLPRRIWKSSPRDGDPRLTRRAKGLLIAASGLALVACAVVAASYAGVGLRSCLVGLARGLRHSGTGHRAYLLGAYSDNGWWYYFLYAYLVKTPIGTLLLLAAALVGAFLRRRLAAKHEIFLGLPVLLIILITCLWTVNIGLRHLLPLYPFLYISAGRLLSRGARGGAAGGEAGPRGLLARHGPWAIAVACLGWNVAEAIHIAPYDLAYFNEIGGGPRGGHLQLLDSNLDWGQGAKALRRYVEGEHLPVIYCGFSGNSDPWYYGVRYQYTPGSGNLDNARERPVRVPDGLPRELLAVSPMVLHSVQFTDTAVWEPLRAQRPIAMPGYAYFVYDITRNAGAHGYLAALYLSFGMNDLADYEAQRTLRLDPQNRAALMVLDQLRKIASSPAGPGDSSPPPAGAPGPSGTPRP